MKEAILFGTLKYIDALKKLESDIKFLEFCEFADAVLKKRLEQLPDVAMVDISGMYQPEMYILPDEAKMKSLNITQDQLKEAIDQNNRVSGSLSIRDGYYQYNIKFTSQLMSVEDVREVYLNIEGRLMQVKDIAEVGIRPRDKRGMFVNGEKQSLCMAVIKQSSARMSEMKEKVSEMLENFETEYPDIEFLQISRDEQKEAWESYIAHKNSPLTQYNSVDMELAEGWQLFYIPVLFWWIKSRRSSMPMLPDRLLRKLLRCWIHFQKHKQK